MRVDHTAIAVHNIDEALKRYKVLLPGAALERMRVADQGVDVAFLSLGETRVELVQPVDDQSGVARFLESRGEGLHHVAIAVADIRHEIERLQAEGVELIDGVPRPGAHGMVAFVHPRSTGGVLVELIEIA